MLPSKFKPHAKIQVAWTTSDKGQALLGYFPSGKKWRRGTCVLPHSRHAFRIVVFLDNVVDDWWLNVVDKWNSLQNSQLQRCLFPKPNYIYVTIVSIVLFRLINISLISSSFQPILGRLGQISWLSLLADHQSLTSRRRTSSLLLLFWLSTLRGSFVPKLLAWVSPGCRTRLATCRSWSPTSREKAGSLWQRGKLRCMPYLNLSHTWR